MFCDSNVFKEIQFFESLYDEDSSFNNDHNDSDDFKNSKFYVNNSILVKAVDVCHNDLMKIHGISSVFDIFLTTLKSPICRVNFWNCCYFLRIAF